MINIRRRADSIDGNKVKITFMSYDGSTTYSSGKYTPGATVTKPTNPTRATTTETDKQRQKRGEGQTKKDKHSNFHWFPNP